MRLALAIAGSLLAGCGARFPRPPYAAQPTSALVEIREPVPPARVEDVPARPAETVWIDGEWTWRRARWAWMPGRWVVPPPGEAFSPWVVVRSDDGRLWLAPGVWRDASGKVVDPPAAVAVATVESGQVVNASGAIEPTGRTLRATKPKPR
ncbi:MAG TPA: YXWGXW repeat-containing protein [Polyangiaceae bacterium]|jgi:hypothetical protein|nr:YXWGXW repeat-containing protein [Polyangiaceae bacterium]